MCLICPWDEIKKLILHIHARFNQEVKAGEVIVAGKNWGCGSSRKQTPANLKKLGVACVAAESFGRIFFRNSIAIALPVIVCPEIIKAFKEGDELAVELESAGVKNITTGQELRGAPLAEDMLAIIRKGGIMAALKEKVKLKV
ncbi:MAG: LeuD/DmdB family oxidoreductase small subunit [Thermodesulfobacteriota bacterium]